MILFKSIKYRNFKAVGNQFVTIELDKTKTTLITGKNGAGKSTITSAICFALFGQDFELSKAGLINSINLKQLEVILEFSVNGKDYKIVRGIKPNVFKIFEGEKLLNEDSSIRDYQKMLETQIIKMDIRAFKQVIIVGSSIYVPFMKLKTVDRREFIEDLLDIRIFSTMGVLLKEKVKQLKEELRSNDEEIRSIKEKVILQEAFVKKLSADKVSKIDKLNETIKERKDFNLILSKKISDLLVKIEKLSTESEKYNGVGDDINKLKYELLTIDKNKDKIEEHIEFYKSTDVCPKCSQDITEKHKQNIVGGHELELNACLNEYVDKQNKLKGLRVKMEEQVVLLSKMATLQEELSEYQDAIKINKSIITSSNEQIYDINNDNSSLNDEKNKLKEFAKRFVDLDKQRKSIIESQQYNDFVQQVLADGGIKTKIIKQYIPTINKYINSYLSALDFWVSFHLDENFNEVIKSRHRDNFKYENFSDGQKARIDLAIMLAWRDVARMRNAVSCNICFFDESDASLDGDGAELFINTLNTLEKSNVFIISHKELLIDKVERVIKFEIKDNYTIVV